jgi:hypothetical protein
VVGLDVKRRTVKLYEEMLYSALELYAKSNASPGAMCLPLSGAEIVPFVVVCRGEGAAWTTTDKVDTRARTMDLVKYMAVVSIAMKGSEGTGWKEISPFCPFI